MLPSTAKRTLDIQDVLVAAFIPVADDGWPCHLVPHDRALGFLLEIEILRLLRGDADTENFAAVELARRPVQTADGIAGLVTDALSAAESVPEEEKI